MFISGRSLRAQLDDLLHLCYSIAGHNSCSIFQSLTYAHFLRHTLIILAICGFQAASVATPAGNIYRKAVNSTVQLILQDEDGHDIQIGTGFLIDTNIVATNFHVVEGAYSGSAMSPLSAERLRISGIVACDTMVDLALLRIDGLSAQMLPLAVEPPDVGDDVFVIGNPKGFDATISNGIVSALRTISGVTLIQITAPISPGSSGSPVFNSSGSVVGVAVLSCVDGQNLNFAIPSELVTRLAERRRPLTTLSSLAKAHTSDHSRRSTNILPIGLSITDSKTESYRFSLSLHNGLEATIYKVRILLIYRNPDGRIVDHDDFVYHPDIPSGLSKRITRPIDDSIANYFGQGGIYAYTDAQGKIKIMTFPHGTIEVRILDYEYVTP